MLSHDEDMKVKRSVIAELRNLIKKMDVDTVDSEMMPKDKKDMMMEIITPTENTASLEKMLPNPMEVDSKDVEESMSPEALAMHEAGESKKEEEKEQKGKKY